MTVQIIPSPTEIQSMKRIKRNVFNTSKYVNNFNNKIKVQKPSDEAGEMFPTQALVSHCWCFGLRMNLSSTSGLRNRAKTDRGLGDGPRLPGGSDGKESACSGGNPGLVPRSGRSPGEGHGIPLQYSCLKNPMDRGAWQATVHGVTRSWTQLSD